MPTITWLGEGEGGAESTTAFKGMAFKKGEAVECEDEDVLERASKNKYFKVSGHSPKTAVGDAPTIPSVVGQDVQHPAPKPGEPLPSSVHTPGPLAKKEAPTQHTETQHTEVEGHEHERGPSGQQGFAPIPPAKK